MILQHEYDNLGLQSVLYPAWEKHFPPIHMTYPKPNDSSARSHRLLRKAGLIFLILLLSFVAEFVVTRYFFQSFKVDGVSMVPTLDNHAWYLLNRWAFHDRDPQRGDVVVLADPEDHGLVVKRVIAMPGDSIHFKNGRVFVNGRKISEPYLLPHTYTFTYSQIKEKFITLGVGQYFVLGDNRPASIDSRSYGAVPRENILGKVVLQGKAAETPAQLRAQFPEHSGEVVIRARSQ
jgi:signal peptidase I